MAKLTNTQYKQLHTILSNLERAYNYIQQPAIIGIAKETHSPLGCDYMIKNPACLDVCSPGTVAASISLMNKSIGSDIAGLSMAMHQLREFLNPASPL